MVEKKVNARNYTQRYFVSRTEIDRQLLLMYGDWGVTRVYRNAPDLTFVSST